MIVAFAFVWIALYLAAVIHTARHERKVKESRA